MNHGGFLPMRSPQAGKVPAVVMRVELSAFDDGTARLNDPTNIARLGKQLTSCMYCGVA